MTAKNGICGSSVLTNGKDGPRTLEDFRGDFGAIASLMEESWGENKNQPLLYTEEFLRSCFRYPGAGASLAPTIYCGAKPAAFVAGFPRKVKFKGQSCNILAISFLTVAPEYKNRFGIMVWTELVKRARSMGFDGIVSYCVDGEAMNGMIQGCFRRLSLPVERIFSVHFLTGLLWPKTVTGANDPGIVEAFMTLAAPMTDRIPLARIWSREEAEWQCTRAGAIVARHREGSRQGMLTGYIMPIADPKRTKCLLVEDLLWGDLEPNERQDLVRVFVAQAAAEGARLASLPVTGYADIHPFALARFRPSPRVLHAYLSIWKDSPAVEPLSSFYLDVF